MKKAKIFYFNLTDEMRKEEKLEWFSENKLKNIPFTHIQPDKNYNWIDLTENDWDEMLPLANKETKNSINDNSILKLYYLGVATNRDEWVYDFDKNNLIKKVKYFIEIYNNSLKLNELDYTIKLSETLINLKNKKIKFEFDIEKISTSIYRNYTKKYFYFDKLLNDRLTNNHIEVFGFKGNLINRSFSINGTNGVQWNCIANKTIIDLNALYGGSQSFPLYRYSVSGERIENITDWGLAQFREQYGIWGLGFGIGEKPNTQNQDPNTNNQIGGLGFGIGEKPNTNNQIRGLGFGIGEKPITNNLDPNTNNQIRGLGFGIGEKPNTQNQDPNTNNQIGGLGFGIGEKPKTNNQDPNTKTQIPNKEATNIQNKNGEKHGENCNIPRPGRLEGSDESYGAGLSSDQSVSEGREVRIDKSNTESGSLNTGEYCGGTRKELSERVSLSSIGSERLTIGIGNSSDSCQTSGLHKEGRIAADMEANSNSGEANRRSSTFTGDSQIPKTKPQKPITKEDIFHYVYAVLHNPAYRKKYELNLKREFPRIPFYDDFWKWAVWGKKLMDLHINFETVEPYPLSILGLGDRVLGLGNRVLGIGDRVLGIVGDENADSEFNSPVPNPKSPAPKTKLKADKTNGTIIIDTQTTLTGIPKEAWEYKLGNRSAIEWILDQYKEKTPRDPTIREKFNTYKFADYKDKVIDLIKRVTTVSVETVKIVREME